ncbi:MAG: pyridoxal kinase, partial [Arachnia sp.]
MHTVLSIQSAVAYGHAGNSSAVFPMQRSGVNVWPVYTVNFSNHTGYDTWRGPMIDADDVASVIQGVDERGVLPQVTAVLSGYQGSADMGQVILDAAALVKQRNPAALFCADPVMGDVGRGFYARPGIPEFMRDHVVQAADILTPNLFELQYLTGRTTSTVGDV